MSEFSSRIRDSERRGDDLDLVGEVMPNLSSTARAICSCSKILRPMMCRSHRGLSIWPFRPRPPRPGRSRRGRRSPVSASTRGPPSVNASMPSMTIMSGLYPRLISAIMRRMYGDECIPRRIGFGVSPTASFSDMERTPPIRGFSGRESSQRIPPG